MVATYGGEGLWSSSPNNPNTREETLAVSSTVMALPHPRAQNTTSALSIPGALNQLGLVQTGAPAHDSVGGPGIGTFTVSRDPLGGVNIHVDLGPPTSTYRFLDIGDFQRGSTRYVAMGNPDSQSMLILPPECHKSLLEVHHQRRCQTSLLQMACVSHSCSLTKRQI